MRRSVMVGIGLLCALAVAGGAVAAWRDRGTVSAFESRLDGNCASVTHRVVAGRRPGAMRTDSLECNMLAGFIEIDTFRSAAARARPPHACLIGQTEAAFQDLYAPGMALEFRSWCAELDGVTT